MNSDPLARYLQRLPTFITFFFSIMLVTVFHEFGADFNFTTGPTFNFSNLGNDLTLLSFLATLFFVVSVWLSYSLLIERFPYTLDYTVFFFDVLRFSALFVIFEFAFLAGKPPYYGYYLIMLGVFHLMMAGWHTNRLRFIHGEERPERVSDIQGHLLRMGIYFVLAIIYFVFVAIPWHNSQPWALHTALVIITSGVLVYLNARRLVEMKAKAMQTQEAAKSQPAAVMAK